MKRHERLPSKFPHVVKVGNAVVKVYRGKTRGYDLFTVIHYQDGVRNRQTFAKFAEARSHAQEIAIQIARGRVNVLSLTNADRDSYVAAISLLRSVGIPLHVAVEEYVAARSHLQDESLLTAVKAYARRSRNHHGKPVVDIVTDLLKDRKQNGASVRYIQSLRSHLTRFADAFHCNIGSLTAKLIEQWLASLKVGPRARNNNRMSVVTLFHYARKHGYLPKDEPTEADAVDKAKDRGGKIEPLRPEQMAKLMAGADGKIALYLALAGFAGIRAAEILRLEWKDFNFVRGHITIAAEKAKTATRRLVPIAPNLAEYLRPYHRATGRLFKAKDDKRAITWAKKKGIDPWPNNCLRHSYASYRLAGTADAARVALELGNSPAKLFSNYRELADEHDAKAWFAISPKRSRNLVTFAA
jgi:integrase